MNRAPRPRSVNGDAVHRKSILAIEEAIHSHIGAALAESHGVANICYSARRHAQQARVVSGGQGQRSYCVRGYDGAYCRSGCLKRFDSRLDGDLFGLSTDFKTAVQHDRLGRSDPNSRCFHRFESNQRELHLVTAGRQQRKPVEAILIRSDDTFQGRFCVCRCDFDAWDQRPHGIADRSCEFTRGGRLCRQPWRPPDV